MDKKFVRKKFLSIDFLNFWDGSCLLREERINYIDVVSKCF